MPEVRRSPRLAPQARCHHVDEPSYPERRSAVFLGWRGGCVPATLTYAICPTGSVLGGLHPFNLAKKNSRPFLRDHSSGSASMSGAGLTLVQLRHKATPSNETHPKSPAR
jgi:hypothetical protein